MRPKLTVVVTCTDRKSAPASHDCQVRNLPMESLTERHDSWMHRLEAAADKRPVGSLYAGAAWRRTDAVLDAAASAGFEPRLFVASAGLGLVAASAMAPAYGATFTARQADSVASSVAGNRVWWARFRAGGGNALPDLPDGAGDATIVVLSEAYAATLDADLTDLAHAPGDHLLVGGARDVPGMTRVRSDLGLRHALGGTALSLNLRMAEEWLRKLKQAKLTDDETTKTWETWAHRVRRIEHYERDAMTDAQVLEFVSCLTSKHPTVSRTRALRALRDSGHACEQARFARLFNQAVIQ